MDATLVAAAALVDETLALESTGLVVGISTATTNVDSADSEPVEHEAATNTPTASHPAPRARLLHMLLTVATKRGCGKTLAPDPPSITTANWPVKIFTRHRRFRTVRP